MDREKGILGWSAVNFKGLGGGYFVYYPIPLCIGRDQYGIFEFSHLVFTNHPP